MNELQILLKIYHSFYWTFKRHRFWIVFVNWYWCYRLLINVVEKHYADGLHFHRANGAFLLNNSFVFSTPFITGGIFVLRFEQWIKCNYFYCFLLFNLMNFHTFYGPHIKRKTVHYGYGLKFDVIIRVSLSLDFFVY